MDNIRNNLIQQFRKFPGIGIKQAERFIYFLLQQNSNYITEFTNNISFFHKSMKRCSESCEYFYDPDNSHELSPIARNPNRSNSQIMVVKSDTDLLVMEKANIYNGRYFVLGNYIDLTKEKPDGKTNAQKLRPLIEKYATLGLNEIIMALPFNQEGDHTRSVLLDYIIDLVRTNKLKVTILARGLSIGAELEYADTETLKLALQNRN